jgi:hypothetical protein
VIWINPFTLRLSQQRHPKPAATVNWIIGESSGRAALGSPHDLLKIVYAKAASDGNAEGVASSRIVGLAASNPWNSWLGLHQGAPLPLSPVASDPPRPLIPARAISDLRHGMFEQQVFIASLVVENDCRQQIKADNIKARAPVYADLAPSFTAVSKLARYFGG